MSKEKEKKRPSVHEELDGFDINISQFGEIKSSVPIEKLNKFLNQKVEDKKLKDRDDIEDLKK